MVDGDLVSPGRNRWPARQLRDAWSGVRRHPRAVEPERHPGRQVDRRHRRAGERGGVEDDQVAGAPGGVEDHARTQPSSSPSPSAGPDEDRLSRGPVSPGSKRTDSSRARSYLTSPSKAGRSGSVAEPGAVAVAVPAARPRPRRCGGTRPGCRRGAPRAPGCRPGRPSSGAATARRRAIGLARARCRRRVVADDVEDGPVAVVEGVEHVEHVARVDRDPPDVGVARRPGHHADPGPGLGHPPEGDRPALRRPGPGRRRPAGRGRRPGWRSPRSRGSSWPGGSRCPRCGSAARRRRPRGSGGTAGRTRRTRRRPARRWPGRPSGGRSSATPARRRSRGPGPGRDPGERACGNPDSTRARVVPAWRMTWVLAGPSIGSPGPLGGTVATLVGQGPGPHPAVPVAGGLALRPARWRGPSRRR